MKAVTNTKTCGVINFIKEIVSNFGVPIRIVCDRGYAFTSKAYETFCKEYDIKRMLNATETPRANGQVERFNRSTLNCLMTSIKDAKNWDLEVNSVK